MNAILSEDAGGQMESILRFRTNRHALLSQHPESFESPCIAAHWLAQVASPEFMHHGTRSRRARSRRTGRW